MKNTCGLHVHFSCQHNTAKVKDSLKKKKKEEETWETGEGKGERGEKKGEEGKER